VRESDTVRYVESFDAGQTWGTEQTALTNIPDYSTRMVFVRYGDNVLFVLVNETNNHVVLYNSTDGKTWTYMTEIYSQGAMVPTMAMLSQTTILWAAADLGTGNVVGGISFVPEMLAYPQTPTNPYPGNNTTITQPETKVRLNVTVHGTQAYDVAFYWANGTFIGEDKLLREGEVATCEVSDLRDGLTYSWYAVTRGTTYDYWGNEPDTTTDEARSATYTFMFLTGKPRLDLSTNASTCHVYGENITIKVDISNASNVEDFDFEILYNTTLLDYTSITWNAWGSGTINIDEDNGKITGSTAGSTLGDNATLITITFSAKCHHLWKDLPGWINDQSGTIYIQGANLSYPGGTKKTYERGGLSEIDIGPDINYTFSPVRGDVDNSGNVDLTDLRTVAAYYGQESTTYNLTGDTIVDIFDLVVIATNYGYECP
jgi:sucrose-6-phosphate hydrolase SacC (GH32 family)